jgi:2-isopropylmalate synthase
MGKYKDHIVKSFDWAERLLIHHDRKAMDTIGPLMAFLNQDMVPEADLNIFVHHIDVKNPPGPDYVDIHAHEVSQAYVFPLKGITFEVRLGDEVYTVDSPATVFIPPGLPHTVKIIKGSGIEVSIVRNEKYEQSLTEETGRA